jgi:hypothetical protein
LIFIGPTSTVSPCGPYALGASNTNTMAKKKAAAKKAAPKKAAAKKPAAKKKAAKKK